MFGRTKAVSHCACHRSPRRRLTIRRAKSNLFIVVSHRPLKFSLGVSLLVHGVAIGGAWWFGHFHHTAATAVINEQTTLELVAAPSAPEQSFPAAPTPPPATPMRALPTPALPVESVLPEQPPIPPVADKALVHEPAPRPDTPVPGASASSTAPTIPIHPALTTTTETGDGSSSIPGPDATTIEGKSSGSARPDYLKNPEPEYPLQARRRGQEGLVLLNVTVSGSGHAIAITLKESSGYNLLDHAALKAVQAWIFEPARIGSVGVESKIEVPVRFKLSR